MEKNIDRTPFGSRMYQARKNAGLSQKEVSVKIGCSQSNLSDLERIADSSGLTPQFADLYKVSANWLSTGIGGVSYKENSVLKSISKEIVIPQFNAVGNMGNGLVLRDQSGVISSWKVSPEWMTKNVKVHTGVKNLAIVTGFGDSMRPMFNSGDPLLIDIGVKSVEFDAIYFFRVGDEGFIKRLQRIPGDGIRAISENKGYEGWTIKPDMDFEVFGRVIKVWASEDF